MHKCKKCGKELKASDFNCPACFTVSDESAATLSNVTAAFAAMFTPTPDNGTGGGCDTGGSTDSGSCGGSDAGGI